MSATKASMLMGRSFLYEISFLMGGGSTREMLNKIGKWSEFTTSTVWWSVTMEASFLEITKSRCGWPCEIVHGCAAGGAKIWDIQYISVPRSTGNINMDVDVANDGQLFSFQQQLFHYCHGCLKEEGGDDFFEGWGKWYRMTRTMFVFPVYMSNSKCWKDAYVGDLITVHSMLLGMSAPTPPPIWMVCGR